MEVFIYFELNIFIVFN